MADDTLLNELRTLETSHVSDALDALGINGQCAGLLPIQRGEVMVGRAFTVKYLPIGAEGGTVGDYIDDLEPGTVVALDNAGRLDVTVWGDLLTYTASRRDLAGTIIDGVCRDTDTALELNYPIYAKSRWMRTGKDRVYVADYQVPISVGGARVTPADYILGDADGVVVIPAGRATEIIDRAVAIRDAEERIRSAIADGLPLVVARRQHGYHDLQSKTTAQ